jgi:hypothetical protein
VFSEFIIAAPYHFTLLAHEPRMRLVRFGFEFVGFLCYAQERRNKEAHTGAT